IARVLSEIFLKEIEMEKKPLITIDRVDTKKDLSLSQIYISVFPQEKTKEVLNFLEKKRGYFQRLLFEKINFKKNPRIVFLENKKQREVEKIEKIIEKIEKGE
ncbi:MAG: ribosome-binding factor A, partial [Minisyncoccales bacterium]